MDAQQVFATGQHGLYLLLMVAGPWMVTTLVEYLRSILMSIPTAVA